MKRIKMLSIMTICILSASFLSCSKNTSSALIPPTAETIDGEKIPVPMGGYNIKLESIPSEYAKRICSAFDKDVTEENLNSLCFEENIVGVGLASVVYFSKYAEKLSDDEWEQFCVIAENHGNDTEIPNQRADFVSRIPDSDYFDAMIEEVINDYCEAKECSRQEAVDFIYSGNVTINTPYNSKIQAVLDKVYDDDSNFTNNTTQNFPQSACTVLDYTGGVAAIVGGNHDNHSYNRSYRIPHQPGSSIKPLSVYMPALSEKIINFSSLIPDEPLSFEDYEGSYNWPKNYDGIYEGNITVTQALRKSKNAAAAKLAVRLTPMFSSDFIKNIFGITTLTDNDLSYAAMALGALENGTYLHELAAAYAVFGNEGNYYKPHFYTEIIDSSGNVVLKNEVKAQKAIESDSAWIMNRLLYYNVNTEDGIANSAALDNIEVIGKTGTASNDLNLDSGRIFVGAVPDYVAAIWIGFDDESSMENVSYTPPTDLWKKIVEQLPLEHEKFTPDNTVIQNKYCISTGDLATSRCRETEMGYYTKENMPDECHE